MNRYRCLVLDHDDTVVNSTATIHYPCFIEYLDLHYPGLSQKYSLEEYFRKNFSPGVVEFFRDEIGMSARQMRQEEAYWAEYVKKHVPNVYQGIRQILLDFRAGGGLIAVDSHSLTCYIERDFAAGGLPAPDIIYGWDLPAERRKPSPWSLQDLCARYRLAPKEILVVDDLKPGYDMARAAGADFAAAGWAYDVPQIENFMRANCDFYCKRVEELRAILFT